MDFSQPRIAQICTNRGAQALPAPQFRNHKATVTCFHSCSFAKFVVQRFICRKNKLPNFLLTSKSHHTTGKNKPPITRMNTDMKQWARVHSRSERGRVKQKLCKQACKIFAFFCQSQLDGIIRAHLLNPWLVLLQARPARSLPKNQTASIPALI